MIILFTALRCKIEELRWKNSVKKYKKQWPDYVDNGYNLGPLKFIWGVKSGDCLVHGDADLNTMNDLDITFNRDTGKYTLGIETIYYFDSKQYECEYYKELLDKFTQYMHYNGLKIRKKYNPIFWGSEFNFEADTIEDLYIQFKIFVIGYCAVLEELNDDDYNSIFMEGINNDI